MPRLIDVQSSPPVGHGAGRQPFITATDHERKKAHRKNRVIQQCSDVWRKGNPGPREFEEKSSENMCTKPDPLLVLNWNPNTKANPIANSR